MSDERPVGRRERTLDAVFGSRMREIGSTAKRELAYYRAVARHPATPRLAKILLGAAIGYLLSPIDLIPDVIPVIGHLDDAVIVPGLILLAIRLIPDAVLEECRRTSAPGDSPAAT
ncbi:MAG: YkvA family protein [Gemmatimonadota bacterium]